MGDRFVISKRGECEWEKFPPFTSRFHMVDDFSTECLVFLLIVILVEDQIFTVSDAATPEEVRTKHALITIDEVFVAIPGFIAEEEI